MHVGIGRADAEFIEGQHAETTIGSVSGRASLVADEWPQSANVRIIEVGIIAVPSEDLCIRTGERRFGLRIRVDLHVDVVIASHVVNADDDPLQIGPRKDCGAHVGRATASCRAGRIVRTFAGRKLNQVVVPEAPASCDFA